MRRVPHLAAVCLAAAVAVSGGIALATQNKTTVSVPGGFALNECAGYEDWAAVAVSQPEDKINLIVANATMIAAYRAGVPGNGKPFPDGSKIVKMLWMAKQDSALPNVAKVPGTLSGIGCMVKDSRRFPEGGGWGYAQFDYVPTTDSLKPNTSAQSNDAKCGIACHTIAKSADYVFTAYAKR